MNLALLRFVVRNARKVSIVRKRYALHCGSVRMLHSNKDPSPNAGEKSKSDQAGVMSTIKDGLLSLWDMIINPRSTWQSLKDTLHHYWVGSKLLWSEVKLAKQILSRVVQGNGMTRRERMQLIRTTTDIFRLVPFAVFVIVPFMEFLLPFALRIFPNMLPSTFQDSLQKEESMKKELKMRLAVAGFMQETLQQMVSKRKNVGDASDSGAGAKEVIDFIEKARLGEPIPNDTVIRIARNFKDELTLANIARPQLVSMCKFMGLQPFGSDAFLRFQLRTKFTAIKNDDKRILWEGVDSLNTLELREACRERGMRSLGLTQFKYRKQLVEWLDLSTKKDIPISLLIMSRAFMLSSTTDEPEKVLQSSMSSLDSDTVNEVVLAAASAGEENTIDIRKRKLESIQFQREMMNEEMRENAEKKSSDKVPDASSNIPILDKVVKKELPPNNDITSTKSKESSKEPQETKGDKKNQVSIEGENDSLNKQLSVDEIQALCDLARGSSVQREKAELAVILAHLEAAYPDVEIVPAKLVEKLDLSDAKYETASKEKILKDFTESVDKDAPKVVQVDKGLHRMKNVVSSMIEKLNDQIDRTEKALGDSLNILDKDNDGELSSDELKEAIAGVFKKSRSPEDAEELIRVIDSNQDGKVSLVELLQYIDKRREEIEVEKLASKNNK